MTLKLIPIALFAALIAAGCGGPQGPDDTAATAAVAVGASGARLLSASGMARLDVPKDALSQPVEMQLVERFDDQGRHEVEIQPAGIVFAKPAKVTFKLPDDVVPEREHAVEVQLGDDHGTAVEIEIEIERQVCDAMERQIEAQIEHAGRFRREDRPL